MSVVDELIARSNRLGADPRNTNYAGGNTSAKGTDTDPVTGGEVELLWVKGSGGDLGTLKAAGLAPSYIEVIMAHVGLVFSVAVNDELIVKNPTKSSTVVLPQVIRKKLVPWTADQVLDLGERVLDPAGGGAAGGEVRDHAEG